MIHDRSRAPPEGHSLPMRTTLAPEEGIAMTAKTAEMTTKDFAAAIGTDPKTLRKFLRATTPRDEQPGKGGRWVLPGSKTALTAARKSFAKWQKEQADAAAERAAKAAKDAKDALDEVEDIDEDSTGTEQDEVEVDEDSHEESEV